MADGVNGVSGQAGATPATQGGGQPSSGNGYTVPQGYRLVAEDEYGQAQRWRQQVEGSKQEFERYKSQFEPWKNVIDTFSKSGVDPKNFTAAQTQLSGPTSGSASLDPQAIESAIEKRFAAFEQRMQKADAMRSHESSMNAQRKALDKLVDDVVGEGADEATKKAVRGMAMGLYNENLQSNFYPNDHPLHQDAFAPLPDDKWAQFGSSVGDMYKALRGSQLGAVADAAAKIGKSAPAGQSSSGATNAKPKDIHENLMSNIEQTLKARRSTK